MSAFAFLALRAALHANIVVVVKVVGTELNALALVEHGAVGALETGVLVALYAVSLAVMTLLFEGVEEVRTRVLALAFEEIEAVIALSALLLVTPLAVLTALFALAVQGV